MENKDGKELEIESLQTQLKQTQIVKPIYVFNLIA